jgi:hypothetical protein
MSISDRLRSLDDRVLKMDRRAAELRTEAGWRRMAAHWRWMAGLAALFLGVPCMAAAFGFGSLYTLAPVGGVLAFQAGLLKGEDDRLHRRGPLERQRPLGS